MEWRSPASPRRKKIRAEKSRIKTMPITFFDNQGIIHKEVLPVGCSLKDRRVVASSFHVGSLHWSLSSLDRDVKNSPPRFRNGTLINNHSIRDEWKKCVKF
ncbi:hypothetical protein TNCV_2029081 [Trichonephila clavipes]|nr:hypothetical protein TNCV_2029081 [Trichonephila clavipes]